MDDNDTIQTTEDQIKTLEKKLLEANNSRDYWYAQISGAQTELRQIHQLLDNLPNSPPRKTSEEYPQDLDLITRLAIYFASRK